MRLSQRNEWIAVGVLIVYIAFVPTLPLVRDLLSGAIGKAVGLAAIVYTWKFISEPVALMLLVAIWRAGGIKEGADDPSMKPTGTDCHCEAGFELDSVTKQCKKGNEMKPSVCCGTLEKWDDATKKCEQKKPATPPPTAMPPTMPTIPEMPKGSGAGGPDGGSTGAAAAMAALNATPSPPSGPEKFSPYEKEESGSSFSPV